MMPDLEKIRDEIDSIDGQIQKLFEQRMNLTGEVAEYKIATGKPVFDQDRENKKLECISESASSDFNAKGICEILRQTMSISRIRQYQMLAEHEDDLFSGYIQLEHLPVQEAQVIYQGLEGAYASEAAKKFFGKCVNTAHVGTWEEAIQIVSKKQADYAVLPIENSTAGIVQDIYDLILEYPVYIVGEQILPIEHELLGLPGADISDVRTVFSHPQALAQCKEYLKEHPDWEQRKLLNTAVAARKVADDKDIRQAAIASHSAGELFGLQRLEEKRLSTEKNSTRFIIISNQKYIVKNAEKISICFELPHKSGSLYHALSNLIYNDLNMTKIESRPIRDRNFEYRFFLDFEGNLSEPEVKNAVIGIQNEADELYILGNY